MNAYLCPSNLRDMGHQSRVDRTSNLYNSFLTDMISEAQNGNLFIDFTVDEDDWSLVDSLCAKIANQHPGVRVLNGKNSIPGSQSNIEVRWD